MEGPLLSVRVLAGIFFVGGSAVAASLFTRYAPVAAGVAVVPAGANAPTDPQPDGQQQRGRAVAVALPRITRVYGIFGVVVPVVGIALAVVRGRMGEVSINIAMVLTVAAGALLALLTRQRNALAETVRIVRPGAYA